MRCALRTSTTRATYCGARSNCRLRSSHKRIFDCHVRVREMRNGFVESTGVAERVVAGEGSRRAQSGCKIDYGAARFLALLTLLRYSDLASSKSTLKNARDSGAKCSASTRPQENPQNRLPLDRHRVSGEWYVVRRPPFDWRLKYYACVSQHIVVRKNSTTVKQHGPRGCTRGEVRSIQGARPLDLIGRNDASGVEAAPGD